MPRPWRKGSTPIKGRVSLLVFGIGCSRESGAQTSSGERRGGAWASWRASGVRDVLNRDRNVCSTEPRCRQPRRELCCDGDDVAIQPGDVYAERHRTRRRTPRFLDGGRTRAAHLDAARTRWIRRRGLVARPRDCGDTRRQRKCGWPARTSRFPGLARVGRGRVDSTAP